MTFENKTTPDTELCWFIALMPYFASATFPFVFRHWLPFMFDPRPNSLQSAMMAGWLLLFICGLIGIVMNVFRGSKNQQLVALMSIPTFVPIAALGILLLYLFDHR